ncbi:MAG: hypothetical protein NZ929_02580 [Aigarchaeota archaeon]|nr:hypothetical protein [Aigarchaeota archaeon]
MPYKIIFYTSGDELSNKVLKILNGLIREVRNRSKLSSRDVWPAHAVTTVKVSLPSTLGKSEELELEIWTTLKNYEEDMKTKFGLSGIPSVKIGDKILSSLQVLDIASDIHALLTSNTYTTAEQIFYHLATTAQSLSEKELKRAVEAEEVFSSNIFRATISEKMANLDKLLKEKKIDEETYKKMKRVYEELLGKSSD